MKRKTVLTGYDEDAETDERVFPEEQSSEDAVEGLMEEMLKGKEV